MNRTVHNQCQLKARRARCFSGCVALLCAVSLGAASTSVGAVTGSGGRVVVVDEQGEERELYGNSYALLIGVSDYTNGWDDLEQIPSEIEEAKNALEKHGFEVTTVVDNTTMSELKAAIDNFIRLYGHNEKNRLVFVYSGHGHTWSAGNQGYLVPSDAPVPDTEDGNPGEAFRANTLHISQMMEWARQMTARHVLFLFDSCFSGMIFKTRGAEDERRRSAFKWSTNSQPSRQFITAGSAREKVPAQSVFMPAFINAITTDQADYSQDGYLTGEELGIYLETVVPRYADQTPQYGTHPTWELSRGNFVFVLPDRATQTEAPTDATVAGDAADDEANNAALNSAALAQELLADIELAKLELAKLREEQDALRREQSLNKQLRQQELQRLAEEKQAEQELAEQRLAEQKLVEQKIAEQRLAEQRLAEEKLAEEKLAEEKLAEEKLAEEKLAEEKLAEEKLAEEKLAEEKLAEERVAEETLAEETPAEAAAEDSSAMPASADTLIASIDQRRLAEEELALLHVETSASDEDAATTPPKDSSASNESIAVAAIAGTVRDTAEVSPAIEAAPSCLPTKPSDSDYFSAPTRYETASTLQMHADPSASCAPTFTVTPTKVVMLLASVDNWVHVREIDSGRTGWVDSRSLDEGIEFDVSALGDAATPALDTRTSAISTEDTQEEIEVRPACNSTLPQNEEYLSSPQQLVAKTPLSLNRQPRRDCRTGITIVEDSSVVLLATRGSWGHVRDMSSGRAGWVDKGQLQSESGSTPPDTATTSAEAQTRVASTAQPALSGCVASKPTPTTTFGKPRHFVTEFVVELRAGPNTDCAPKRLGEQHGVLLLAKQGEWIYLRDKHTGRTGWTRQGEINPDGLTGYPFDLRVSSASCLKFKFGVRSTKIINECERDIVDLRICEADSGNRLCDSNWQEFGMVARGKAVRTKQYTKFDKPSLLIQGCLSPSSPVSTDDGGYDCL